MRPHLEPGAVLFDAQHYWEAHEAWEVPWLEAKKNHQALEAHYLQGLILLAATLHKGKVQGNLKGGRLNLQKSRNHLERVPDGYGLADGIVSLEILMSAVSDRLELDHALEFNLTRFVP
jgi:uncharacterized protein